jgi:integrase
MHIKITPNDKGNPPGNLADAELHFTDGPLDGLKLIGFGIWERRTGGGRNVTFPARQYSVNGERRSPVTEVELLKQAMAWRVIDAMPCTIRLLKVARSAVTFYDFAQYERLVAAAKNLDYSTYLIVLLGGEAGLRSGEIVGLEWGDVDFANRLLCVQRNVWEGQVDSPKGGRIRYVPLTRRLVDALRNGRGMPNTRVLRRHNGKPFTEGAITHAVVRAARLADLPANGPHRLRHTFCSHLAMRGAPPRAIQELAGHAHVTTTQRYMHLSSTSLSSAINLLEKRGDILETETAQIAISSALTS